MPHQPFPDNPAAALRQMQAMLGRLDTDVSRLLRRAGDAHDQRRYDTAPQGGGSGSGSPAWAKITLGSGQKLRRGSSGTGAGYKYNALTNAFDISLSTVTATNWNAITGLWIAGDIVLCVLVGSTWYGTGSGRHEFRGTNDSGGTIAKGATGTVTISGSVTHAGRAFDAAIPSTKAIVGWWNEDEQNFDISAEC